MTAPRIRTLSTETHAPLASFERAFVVTRAGDFAGRAWEAEEVVVVGHGLIEEGDLVVMIDAAHGVARLGRLTEGGLLGAAGEPCSRERWQVLGGIVRTMRSRPPFWLSVEPGSGEAAQAGSAEGGAAGAQLSLFAA